MRRKCICFMLKTGLVYCLEFVLSFLLVKKDQNMDLMSYPGKNYGWLSNRRYNLSPIYKAENFWHDSDEKSTRTKKIGSARIDLVV